jgi:hypothetical protein
MQDERPVDEGSLPALPDVGDICMNLPLYRIIAKGERAQAFAEELTDAVFQLDAYCVQCQRETPFKKWVLKIPDTKVPPTLVSTRTPMPRKTPASMFQHITAVCCRCGKHYFFYFGAYRDGIAKVGQVPSPADIASPDTLRFRGELPELDLRELEHATRMFSLGIGVAAFVYLRRIFERLLDRHHQAFVSANGAIEGYERMTWEDRVLALRTVLPVEVVENRRVYSILSLGIHELNEDECLAYYPVMRAAIIDILEQDLAAKQRAKASAELRSAVADIGGKLRPER